MWFLMLEEVDDLDVPSSVHRIPPDEPRPWASWGRKFAQERTNGRALGLQMVVGEYLSPNPNRPVLQPSLSVGQLPKALIQQPGRET